MLVFKQTHRIKWKLSLKESILDLSKTAGSMTLTKDIPQNENYKAVSIMIMDTKIPKKMLTH